jgi:hypothetical protein
MLVAVCSLMDEAGISELPGTDVEPQPRPQPCLNLLGSQLLSLLQHHQSTTSLTDRVQNEIWI